MWPCLFECAPHVSTVALSKEEYEGGNHIVVKHNVDESLKYNICEAKWYDWVFRGIQDALKAIFINL